MHEFSICIALLEQVERIARENRAGRVERIVLQIGPLSGVEAPLLQHAYPLAAAGTVAEQAALVFEPAPVVVKCSQCGAESQVEPNRLVCPACGDYHTCLLAGDEMLLARVELSQIEEGDTSCV